MDRFCLAFINHLFWQLESTLPAFVSDDIAGQFRINSIKFDAPLGIDAFLVDLIYSAEEQTRENIQAEGYCIIIILCRRPSVLVVRKCTSNNVCVYGPTSSLSRFTSFWAALFIHWIEQTKFELPATL